MFTNNIKNATSFVPQGKQAVCVGSKVKCANVTVRNKSTVLVAMSNRSGYVPYNLDCLGPINF